MTSDRSTQTQAALTQVRSWFSSSSNDIYFQNIDELYIFRIQNGSVKIRYILHYESIRGFKFFLIQFEKGINGYVFYIYRKTAKLR